MKRALFLALVVAGSLGLSLSKPARAEEPLRVAGREETFAEVPPPSARGALALTGGAIFAVWYAGALGESLLWPDAPSANSLRIPVVGPWITLSHAGCGAAEPNCGDLLAVVRAVLTVIDGVGQLGGLAVIGEAAFLPTAPRQKRTGRRLRTPAPRVSLMADQNLVGLRVAGAF